MDGSTSVAALEPAAPPQNIEAERELLGAVLCFYTPRIVAEIKATGLQPSDFYRVTHGLVWRTIVDLDAAGEFVDPATVARVAGDAAGVELLAAFAVAHGVCERARMVWEDSGWRRRLGGLYGAVEACYLRDGDAFAAAMTVAA